MTFPCCQRVEVNIRHYFVLIKEKKHFLLINNNVVFSSLFTLFQRDQRLLMFWGLQPALQLVENTTKSLCREREGSTWFENVVCSILSWKDEAEALPALRYELYLTWADSRLPMYCRLQVDGTISRKYTIKSFRQKRNSNQDLHGVKEALKG